LIAGKGISIDPARYLKQSADQWFTDGEQPMESLRSISPNTSTNRRVGHNLGKAEIQICRPAHLSALKQSREHRVDAGGRHRAGT
jgi:hypothetical protein